MARDDERKLWAIALEDSGAETLERNVYRQHFNVLRYLRARLTLSLLADFSTDPVLRSMPRFKAQVDFDVRAWLRYALSGCRLAYAIELAVHERHHGEDI